MDCSDFFSSMVSLTGDDIKVDYRNAMVLHCGMCNTVWADTLDVCGEYEHTNSVICIRVSDDVVVKDELEFRLEGRMAGCTYKALHCAGCHCFVGVVPYSTPQHLSALRSLFLLQKENINCYILKDSAIVKASALTFESSAVSRRLEKLKEEVDAVEEHLSVIEMKLKEAYI